jgi:hypothetical protein
MSPSRGWSTAPSRERPIQNGNGFYYLCLGVLAKACELGLEGHRVEAGGRLLQERQKPQLVGDQEPGFRQDVIRIAVTAEAFEAVSALLSMGDIGFEREPDEKGGRFIWLEPASAQRSRLDAS